MIENIDFWTLLLAVISGCVANLWQNRVNKKDTDDKITNYKENTDKKIADLGAKAEANKDEIARVYSEIQMEFAKCHAHCRNVHGGLEDE